MDPLSITVSVLTILGAGGSVGKAVQKLVRLRQAPDALLALNNEISDFHIVVSRVESLIRLHQSAANTTTTLRESLLGDLGPLLERGKEKLLELANLIEHTLTSPRPNGEYLVNKIAWSHHQKRVKTLQDDIRSVKTSIVALVSVLASTTAISSAVQVTEIRLITGDIAEQQHQNRALTDQVLIRQMNTDESQQRIQNSLDELIRIQTSQVTRSFRDSRPLSRNSTIFPSFGKRDRWAFLVRSKNTTQYSKCHATGCACSCHLKTTWKSPGYVKHLLGLLFVGYSGVPFLKPLCDDVRCQQKLAVSLNVRYYFPGWFLACVLDFCARFSTPDLLAQHFQVSTVIPSSSKVYTFLSTGDIDGFKEYLLARECSPFGIDMLGQTLLDVCLKLWRYPLTTLT